MGGKCVKGKNTDLKKDRKRNWNSDVVYREEISVRYKEIKALWPNQPYLDARKNIWSEENPSRCSTPRWANEDI
jgi:hypothetical protein